MDPFGLGPPLLCALAGKPWTLHDAGRLDLPPAFVASELSKAMENGSYGAFVAAGQ